MKVPRPAPLARRLSAILPQVHHRRLRDPKPRPAKPRHWPPPALTTAIVDSRTVQSTPEGRARVVYDGAKRRDGSTVHAAVDILDHPLALHTMPMSVPERTQVGRLAVVAQEARD